VQNRFLTADNKRVTGIVPALESRNSSGPIRQQVDNFSLALVTPLGADDDNILTH
jgi:hypothetical protein